MITIDNALKSRMLQNQQTLANLANPSMEVIVTRPRTVMFDKKFWQETIITAGASVTCTTVAVRRMTKRPDKVYVGYIAGSTLVVKSATLTFPISNMLWNAEATIENCNSCALEYDGIYSHINRRIEYLTEETPWLFYTTSSGELRAGLLGGSYEILGASGVVNIDTVRGSCSKYKDLDQGLIIFYIMNGNVYYRQLINGVWQGQLAVTIAPANPVAIKVERLFDYRLCLHIEDSAGALWEVFTKMDSSGWNSNEHIDANLRVSSEILPIRYLSYAEYEHISAFLNSISVVLYALSPVLVSAYNIDNGQGNFGLKLIAEFDECIFREVDNKRAFSVTNEFGGAWGSTDVSKIGDKLLEITFADFNNVGETATLTYTKGTLMGDVVEVDSDSIVFTPISLIPTELPKPACISVSNTDAKTVLLEFDMPVESLNLPTNKVAFIVSSTEYNMIPEGVLSTKNYIIDSVEYYSEITDVGFDLTQASMSDTQIVDTTCIQLLEV